MRKILLAVVALSLLAGSTAQAFPFKKKKKKQKPNRPQHLLLLKNLLSTSR